MSGDRVDAVTSRRPSPRPAGLPVDIDRLTVTYGSFAAVDDVSFSVQANTIHGLIGSNGAGKTTTLECLVGLRRATSGRASLFGEERPSPELLAGVGVFLQERGALPGRLRVGEVVRLYRSFSDDPRPGAEVLAALGLTGLERSFYRSLSGGERARLHVALALLGRPDLLVLDEPSSGLDPEARYELWRVLEEERRHGRTMLVTTHLLDEAERFCDRVTILHRGRVVADDAPRALIADAGEAVLRFPAPSDWVPPSDTGRWWGRERDAVVLVVGNEAEAKRAERGAAAVTGSTTCVERRPLRLEDLYLCLTGHLQPVNRSQPR